MKQRDHSRRESCKIALCGVMAALSVVILSLGGLIPLATFACPMLTMLCLIPLVCEYGPGVSLLLYTAVAILGLLLCPDKEIAFLYIFLGWYPALRPRLDGVPHALRWVVMCGLFSVAMVVMYALLLHLFRLEAVVEEFADYSTAMVLVLLALGNVTFLLYDRLLARLTVVYQREQYDAAR